MARGAGLAGPALGGGDGTALGDKAGLGEASGLAEGTTDAIGRVDAAAGDEAVSGMTGVALPDGGGVSGAPQATRTIASTRTAALDTRLDERDERGVRAESSPIPSLMS